MRTIENRTEDMIPNALNALLGVALLMMPWYLSLGSETAGAQNAFVCGMAIAIIAVLALSKSYDWEEYINLAVGLWVSIAPWALGFADSAVPTWTHVVIGLAVAALAAFELWRLLVSPRRVRSDRPSVAAAAAPVPRPMRPWSMSPEPPFPEAVMPLDPVALAAAATFTAGCAGIHALRRHTDVVTLVLSGLAYELITAIGWMLAGRSGLLGLSDPVPAWALVATASI